MNKTTDLVNDLGDDVTLAILMEKKYSEKIQSGEILSLISKIREALEPLSSRENSYPSEAEEVADVMTKTH